MDKLEQLKQYTTVVADTGDFESIQQYHPQDATTNPTLLLRACAIATYQPLISAAIEWAKQQGADATALTALAVDKLFVNFAQAILDIIPGRVSLEIDARLSYDTQASIERARAMITLLEAQGIPRERIYIKIASTWEGIQAAAVLEKEGIACNLTLLFSFPQAVACANAEVHLVSPFVGRISDWYQQKNQCVYAADEDPGVLSVKQIYTYYKQHQVDTIIMGASFRNIGQIEALAGCDYLTISPALLATLQSETGELKRCLEPTNTTAKEKIQLDQATFHKDLQQDPMASEKLAQGIELFSQDLVALEKLVSELL